MEPNRGAAGGQQTFPATSPGQRSYLVGAETTSQQDDALLNSPSAEVQRSLLEGPSL